MLLEAWKEKRRETMRTRVTMERRLPWSLVLHNIRFRGERASDDHDAACVSVVGSGVNLTNACI